MKDNFWEMGDTGPCGPCSEIHIDLTPDKSGKDLVNAGDARVMEIWNLVFIQFNRGADGKLTPLPAKHVDTGMGFERLCSVLQGAKAGRLGKFSNYDTDVFTPIFRAIQKRTGAGDYQGTLPGQEGSGDQGTKGSRANRDEGTKGRRDEDSLRLSDQVMIDVSYRVIADHIRTLTFAITDGAIPSNEGRGYVLRRILRRAVRYGRQYMNMHEPFLCDLVQPLVDHMGDAFPELRKAHGGRNVEHVKEVVRDEEVSFIKTLDRGIKLFSEAAEHARAHHHGKITGEDAFKLHDTYGFPIDLTELMAEEQELTIDIGEYERLMEEARERARETRGGGDDEAGRIADWITSRNLNLQTDDKHKYQQGGNLPGAMIIAMVRANGDCEELMEAAEPQKVAIVLDKTNLYAEQGGQVGDTGLCLGPQGRIAVRSTFRVKDAVLHFGDVLGGRIRKGDKLTCVIGPFRSRTEKHHTSTHILNWALREVLGDHVQQKGSLVDPEKTRFDFSHNKPLSDEEIEQVESQCRQQIEADYTVFTQEVEQKKAREINTLRAVFGEKYPDVVRVVSIGADIDQMLADPKNPKWMKYSVEFCGGTHLKTTRDAGAFVLTAEEGVAKGVRRVVGISGELAQAAIGLGEKLLKQINNRFRPGSDTSDTLPEFQQRLATAEIPVLVRREIQARVADLHKQAKEQEKASAASSGEAVMDAVAELFKKAENVGGVTVVVGEVPAANADALRAGIDWVRNKTEASAVLLASVAEGKVTMVAGMSKAAVDRGLKAGDLIKEVSPLVGGKGGGRPDMAQGGGPDASGLGSALARAIATLRERA
jgi:alanyl-tRNA synthetase